MAIDGLDHAEMQLLAIALRFWRARRADGLTRRSDAVLVSPDGLERLLAKLEAPCLSLPSGGGRTPDDDTFLNELARHKSIPPDPQDTSPR